MRLRSEPMPEPSPDEIDHAFTEQLQAALAVLDSADRELLVAKYEEGCTTAELAARAECSPKAMESRLARLRKQVRDCVLNRLRHEA